MLAAIRRFVAVSVALSRPLIEHSRPLPNGDPGARAYPDVAGEDGARLVEITPSIQHAQNPLRVLGPQLDLVEIAIVCVQRVVGLLVGPVAHWRRLRGRSVAQGRSTLTKLMRCSSAS